MCAFLIGGAFHLLSVEPSLLFLLLLFLNTFVFIHFIHFICSSSTSPFVNLMRNLGSFARSFCARTLPSRPFRRYDDIDDKTQTSLR